MATLGSAPSFNTYRWADVGSDCFTAPNQVSVGDYTMPSAGWVTGVIVFVGGDGSTQTVIGCVWNTGDNLLGNGSGVSGSGSRGVGSQSWLTCGAGFFLASGSVIRIGWTKASGATMVWSAQTAGGGRWGFGGNPGAFSNCGDIEQPGAYINYNPISNPSATTTAASGIGSTTATLNGTVGDGGQNGPGVPNHSKYYFQYGTDSGLAGATSTAQTNFDGTNQTAVISLTGLAVNTTYYFQVIAIKA